MAATHGGEVSPLAVQTALASGHLLAESLTAITFGLVVVGFLHKAWAATHAGSVAPVAVQTVVAATQSVDPASTLMVVSFLLVEHRVLAAMHAGSDSPVAVQTDLAATQCLVCADGCFLTVVVFFAPGH